MESAYLWLKAVHIVAMVAWMAGLFYLPRLFVYHRDVAPGSTMSEIFKVMERRLLAAIMRPAMIITIVAGLLLLVGGNWYDPVPGWLTAKIFVVAGLLGFHFVLESFVRLFQEDKRSHTQRFYRILNELPTLLLVAIVILVVIKPTFRQ